MSSNKRVRVVVRTRPTANFAHDMISLEEDRETVSIHLPKNSDQLQGFINNQTQDWGFKMDGVLHNASQEDVYTMCAHDLVTRLMEGYNGTVLAYGETGAGKTYTMSGASEDYRLRGVIPRALAQVFQEIREKQESSITVRISYLELYNEVMYDLLCTLPETEGGRRPSSLTITEDDKGAVSVKGLTTRLATNEEEALNMLFEGETNRSIAEHCLNKTSSRSHCIFTIHVESRSRTYSSAEYTISKLNLVDLAGSERLGKTNSTGVIQREAVYINKSLSFLEQVIVALADKRRGHVPFRQSKLTHLLKDSLGGNCLTLMIANIWAEAEQIEETISTLKFARRMMGVSIDPVQNLLQDPRLLVKQYEQEIRVLKQELAMHDTIASRGSVGYDPLSEGEVKGIQKQVRQFVEGTLPEIEIINMRQIKEVFAQFKEFVQAVQQHQESQPTVTVEDKTTTRPASPPPTKQQQKTKGGKLTAPPAESESEQLVGDIDGTGFGLGVALSSMKHPASPVAATRKVKIVTKQASEANKRKDSKLSAIVKSSESPVQVPSETNEEGHPLESVEEPRPSTPPPRAEAFEQFKKERGSEINKILISNKESLHRKKREATEKSSYINEMKRKIDQLRAYLDHRREERADQLVTTETGEAIIDEKEYQTITELKQLKAQYREQYESLQALQSEVQYCKQYVDQSRAHLLREFESWYNVAFVGDSGEEREKKEVVAEYDHEEFDRLQTMLLKGDPATMAFYNAQLRTEKRSYELVAKKPGQVTSTVRNRPPGVMTFS